MAAATTTASGNVVVRCALCGLWLMTPILMAGVVGALGDLLPIPETIMIGSFPFLLALFYGLAGAMWARGIGRIFGWHPLGKVGLVGAVGLAIPTVIAIIGLGLAEENLLELRFDGWQMHVLYGLLFVPTTLLIATIGAGALVWFVVDWQTAWRVGLRCGLIAALTFLVVTVIFDIFGMRVGAPRAEERATMLVVTLAGMWAAALAGSGALGWMLARRQGSP